MVTEDNKDKELNRVLELINNKHILKERLANNYSNIEEDRDLHTVIQFLTLDCIIGNKEERQQAKDLLEDIGLGVAIPDVSKTRITGYYNLKFFQDKPEILIQLVEVYGNMIERISRENINFRRKKYDFKKGQDSTEIFALGFINQDEINTELKKELNLSKDFKFKGRANDKRTLAFACIGHRFKIDEETIKSLYYRGTTKKYNLPYNFVFFINDENEPVQWVNDADEKIEFFTYNPSLDTNYNPEILDLYFEYRNSK